MRPRLAAEVALLRERHLAIEHREHGGEDWFRVPAYQAPDGVELDGEAIDALPIVFKVSVGYPVDPPYAFLVPMGVTLGGVAPNNASAEAPCPFAGAWRQLSWAPDGWNAANDPRYTLSLVRWVGSFAIRLGEGA